MLNGKVHIMILASLAAYLSACTGRTPEQPGDMPNPKLVALINGAIAREIAGMDPAQRPGLLPQAGEHARQWLKEISQVVARCRYGPGNDAKSNLLEYDIVLVSGEEIKGVYSGQRCYYPVAKPLVMRVRFQDGQVQEVTTDGRERERPVDGSMGEIQQFAERVLRADWRRNPARYFRAVPGREDMAREWDMRKS
ncbi:hypothetical protein GCM10023165_36920 [Variovorax defluvii]|uniref:Lipoprotein n=2 Tax=Variovorax defluvii TaxID=913761 RepID=A0ABP8I2J8_9BURK